MTPRRRKIIPALVALALLAAVFAAGILVTRRLQSSPAGLSPSGFSDADRLRFRAALEKLRYELRSPPGSPPFEQVVDQAALQAAVDEETKKARLLREKCNVEITNDMLQTEYERLQADPGDTRVLAAIVGALDNDPAAVIEFWMRPTLVDRYLRACVSDDAELNAPARRQVEELRQSGAAGERVTLNLQDEGLEPEDRDALWSAAAGARTATVESPTDFHFFVVESRSGETVEAGLVSAPKPRFEEWLRNQP